MEVLSFLPLLLGIVICVAVCAQTGAWFTGFLRQWRHEGEVFERRRQLLHEQIAIAHARRMMLETKRFAWQGFRRFVVHAKQPEADGVVSLYLVPQDQRPLPEFEAGQYVAVRVQAPAESKAWTRCYSLSDRPRQEFYRCTVKLLAGQVNSPDAVSHELEVDDLASAEPRSARTGRGKVSGFIHDSLQPGDVIELKAPQGDFVLDPFTKRPAILIAAGIGITPLFSMISDLTHRGLDRQIVLVQGFRNGREQVFGDAVKDLQAANPRLQVVTCYSSPDPGDRQGQDFDLPGRIDRQLIEQLLPSLNYEFYLCGPAAFMEDLVGGLTSAGVPEHLIHFEAFGPSHVAKPPKNAAIQSASCRVTFSKTGNTATWADSSGTLLDLAEQQGVPLDSSCRQGTCGTCVTRLLKGQVNYESPPDFECGPQECLPCVARPSEDVELDA